MVVRNRAGGYATPGVGYIMSTRARYFSLINMCSRDDPRMYLASQYEVFQQEPHSLLSFLSLKKYPASSSQPLS